MVRQSKRRLTIDEKLSQPSTRVKGERWTQEEMETLVSLCLAHGRSGILSKETNKATTAKKDSQWITVQSNFSSVCSAVHVNVSIAAVATMW